MKAPMDVRWSSFPINLQVQFTFYHISLTIGTYLFVVFFVLFFSLKIE